MKHQSAEKNVMVFIGVCLLALVLTFFGLRIYFNEARLGLLLTQVYSAEQFQVRAGQASIDNSDLLVDDIYPDGKSLIALDKLRIDSDLYDAVTVVFTDKHIQQPLSVIFTTHSGQTVEQPILYTHQSTARLVLSDVFPKSALITDVGLQTHNLMSSYRIRLLRFQPKRLGHLAFAQLIAGHFVELPSHMVKTNYSLRSVSSMIWSPKMLLLLYFAVVGVLYGLYLWLTRQRFVNAWWATSAGAWFVLDIHYLLGKAQLLLGHFQHTNSVTNSAFNSPPLISFIAVLLPWLLGFVMIKPWLKQRYGYRAFALGAGYLLGWWFMLVLTKLSQYFHYPLNTTKMLLVMSIVGLPLLLLKAKPCTIDEQRLEKAPSNLAHLLSLLVILALLLRWGMILLTVAVTPNEVLTNTHGLTTPTSLHFAAFVQNYVTNAWVNLPWVGVSIALFFVVFGGLRYLGARLLPAMLAGYMAVSLPLWDMQVSLGGEATVWAGLGLLIVALLLVMLLTFAEWRLLVLLIVFAVSTYLTQSATWSFLLALILVVFWRLLGGAITVVLLIAIVLGLLFSDDWLAAKTPEIINDTLTKISQSEAPKALLAVLREEWLIWDNWHYAFVLALGSLLIVLLTRMPKSKNNGLALFMVTSVILLCAMLGLLWVNAGDLIESSLVQHINQTALLFMPIFTTLPVCAYLLSYHDEETIPTI